VDQWTTLSELCVARRLEFESGGDPGVIDEAVNAGLMAVAAVPDGHPDRPDCLSNLSVALRARFLAGQNHDDLDKAVAVGREAVAVAAADDPNRGKYLNNLGIALQAGFGDSHDPSWLDEAVQVARQAVAVTAESHANFWKYALNLGVAANTRFAASRDLADVNEEIGAMRQAAATIPADNAVRWTCLSSLLRALAARYELARSTDDLNEVVTVARQALAAAPADDPNRLDFLSSLGFGLETSFERGGNYAELDEALQLRRLAVALTTDGHPNRGAALNNLGVALETQYERTGNLTDLDEAIDAERQAIALLAPGDLASCEQKSNLSVALWKRGEGSGSPASLNESVLIGRQAVADAPDDHPNRAGILSNLGAVLQGRSERTGDLGDLDEAVHIHRRAAAIDHPDHGSHLANLAGTLQLRFDRTADMADLNEAIDVGRQAAAAMPEGSIDLHDVLGNLSVSLRLRSERDGNLTDLDDAIRVGRRSVAVTPDGHMGLASHLGNLGPALWDRFERTGERDDIDEAVEAERRAVAVLPSDHPDRALYLFNLGLALQVRFRHGGDAADVTDALAAFTDTASMAEAAPTRRIEAARAAAALAEGQDVAKAARLLESAVRLLPQTTPRELLQGDKQHALAGFAGLSSHAAALALEDETVGPADHRASRALRLLEMGRAVLLSQALDTRSDLNRLRRRHPDLADAFARLRDELDAASSPPTPSQHAARDRHQVAADFAALLEQIRAQRGFAGFLHPPTAEELISQSGEGPIVIYNVDERRSDAILLSGDRISALRLPALTPSALADRIGAFHQALRTARDLRLSSGERRAAQTVLHEVLEWLWDNATGPVLDRLGFTEPPGPGEPHPRLWWIPGGLLGLLPVHAAGYHREQPLNGTRQRTVMDRVVSSYTPTIGALRHARARRLSPGGTPSVPARSLIVAMPTTAGAAPLANAAAEATVLSKRLPYATLLMEGRPPSPLVAETPTLENVLNELGRCSIAHFACHGYSDPGDPSRSRLLLHDQTEPLTVASLVPVRLGQARLAYLSACQSATNLATSLLDEAIHLSAAFQIAGFPQVIGTLWEIDDKGAVRIADGFYASLDDEAAGLDTGRAAHALHGVLCKERDMYFRTPSLWAAHMHAGA
jgi:hypothetical protein